MKTFFMINLCVGLSLALILLGALLYLLWKSREYRPYREGVSRCVCLWNYGPLDVYYAVEEDTDKRKLTIIRSGTTDDQNIVVPISTFNSVYIVKRETHYPSNNKQWIPPFVSVADMAVLVYAKNQYPNYPPSDMYLMPCILIEVRRDAKIVMYVKTQNELEQLNKRVAADIMDAFCKASRMKLEKLIMAKSAVPYRLPGPLRWFHI